MADAARVWEPPGPDVTAALASLHGRLAGLAGDTPPVRMLRVRALLLDARIAGIREDAATAVPTFDEAVTLCREIVDGGSAIAPQAADCAVEASTDTAMVFLASGDLAAAELRLQRAEEICATCDVRPALRLDLLNVWTFVDMTRSRWGSASHRAEAAVALGREVGGASMVTATSNLAQVCRYLGDLGRARVLYDQVMESPLLTKAQDRTARLGRAVVAGLTGAADAVPLLLEVVDLAQRDQDGERLAHAATMLGSMARADGQTDAARAWYATATAAAAQAPVVAAGCYLLLANTWDDPVVAEQLRHEARRTVRDVSVELRVLFDLFTSRDSLASGVTEDLLDVALPAALVADVWRIDLPGVLRELWQQTEQLSGTGLILRLAHDLGRHDLVAAIVVHLAATVPPALTSAPVVDLRGDVLPPRVLVAGQDPLAGAARVAVERYARPVRDDERTFDAYANPDGCLDLVAVGRGDTYLCWRRPSTGQLHSVRVARDGLAAPLAELEAASGAALVAPGGSALLRRAAESDLMGRLGVCLLPPPLVADLEGLAQAGPARLRVRADGDLAGVPWGLLVVPGRGDARVVELVDVVTVAPFGLPVPDALADVTDGVLTVLDPRVPGFSADSALGSVLGTGPTRAPLEQRMLGYQDAGRLVAGAPDGRLVRRRDTDRAWLAQALSQRPARLLYLGHVSTVVLTDGVTSEPALHLCCSADVPGRAAPLGAHRPLAASDILADDLRYPSRVALVACASGDDARTRDAYGLVHALLCRGAGLVTGLLWPLPTGRWYSSQRPPAPSTSPAAQSDANDDPLVTLTLAVDRAHESADPVRSLNQWQRECLRRWRTGGSLCDSPIGWGGLHTVVPAAEVTARAVQV